MTIAKAFRPLTATLALAAAAALGGCQNAEISFNGEEGVPLSELDMSGDAPTEIALMGPDRVVMVEGSALSIEVEGDNSDNLRFVFEDGSLGIMRENNSWSGSAATITVTMPPPEDITVAGSGTVIAPGMARDAEISIAGSGTLRVERIAADSLDLTIAGSGDVEIASGTVRELEISVMGSGDADLLGVKADSADVTIAGSGDAAFASDGDVDVSIMGSGDVTVRGNANCTVETHGSGTVTCERTPEAETAG